MKIKFVEIQNFRKLKSCRVDLSDRETIFVGANNSGKTSAMDALILFLKDKSFSTRDFTLSNWIGINNLAKLWIKNDNPDLSLDKWYQFLPQLDIWLEVENSELHHVNHIIPTLDWKGGLLGVRLCLEPKDIKNLCRDFRTAHEQSIRTSQAQKGKSESKLRLWPVSMSDFLDRKLATQFVIKSYLLDPNKVHDCEKGEAKPQAIPPESLSLDVLPFKGLIKVDIINAQRGFTDVNADNVHKVGSSLSSQLRDYYSKHLDPTDQPVEEDLEALNSIEIAKNSFDEKLKERFVPSLAELEMLNYPGFGNPKIAITSKINAIDGLNHGSAVQFGLLKETDACDYPISLPEKYNGLGYQNLISMVFKLIRFRDEWMKVGKRAKQKASEEESQTFEPLHLVLVEEPEAHLHAQVQQVFIRKAYDVLRNHSQLMSKTFSTQLVVSTHSNHIAHEIDFTALRYFKRNPELPENVPTSCVINLSKTFGSEDDTTKFAIRYLKTTHCDLFFADAVILIEGSAERMLLPHFIYNHYPELLPCYISMLEIGGSHAHKLKPLIEDLGIITLIITDIDSVDPSSNRKSIQPERKKNYETNNSVLKTWLPVKTKLDDLLDLPSSDKLHPNQPIRVAYQHPLIVNINQKGKGEEAIPYTFEDSLVFKNLTLFKELTGTGLVKKFNDAANKPTVSDASKAMFEALDSAKKAEFALDLLYIEEPKNLLPPNYIAEGLDWLKEQLKGNTNTIIEKIKNNAGKKQQ